MQATMEFLGAAMKYFAVVLLLFAALHADAAEAADHRKLLQLQQPWLRLPAGESINPARFLAAIGRQFGDRLSYGVFEDYTGDFFDSSFDLVQSLIGDIGTSFGL